MPASQQLVNSLCLQCGLCCNGVLFKDVELQPGDAPARLQALGLPVRKSRLPKAAATSPANKPVVPQMRFAQPCAALCGDNRCRVYSERPMRCRDFECALLKATAEGTVAIPEALRLVRGAHRRADAVRRLLRDLGDTDEHLPLSRRFRNTRRRIESGPLDDSTADRYAELTLAVHDLNLRLARDFYPGQ